MTDEAKFQFYLNRQGVRGKKGEKGDTGFSPTVEVNTNTAAEYTLKITNEDGEFVTDNLRGSAVDDRGGTYMRYDPETQEMYAGNPDSAATNQAGVVIFADQNSIEQISDATALTPEGFVDNLKTFLKSSDNSVSITQDENDSKTDLTVDLSGISGDISGLDSRVTGCESAIDTIENTTIPAIQGDIDQLELNVADKVDKVEGKGLSTNDFTDEDNDKLMHAVVDSDLANVAFTGDYDDLTNKPTIPVIPANNLTGDSVDGTTIVYNSTTGKISATDQTPDLSNYVTKNTAQEISNTKTFLGNSLQVGDGNESDIVASYDTTVYPTTTPDFSRIAGTVLGSLQQNSNSVLATQVMFEYDDSLQNYRLANIFNDYNLTGGTNVSIIKNSNTGLYEIVANDTTYTEGNGIYISDANVISAKVDGTTITANSSGELQATQYTLPIADANTLGGIKPDGTSVVVDANGVLSATAQTPDLSNYVDKTTTQYISGSKYFQVSGGNILLGTTNSKDGITFAANSYAKNWHIYGNGYTASTMTIHGFKTTTINAGNTSSNSKLVLSHDSLIFNKSDNTQVDLLAGYTLPTASTTDLGGVKVDGSTVTIDSNGVISAQGGAQIDDTTVSTGTCYSSNKTVDFVTGAIQDALDTVGDGFVAKTDIATSSTAGIVKPDGSTITVAADGTISANSSYTLPTASTTQLGGVKVDGTSVTIDANGVISAAGSAPSNMVTTDTQQTITGRKTFSNSSSTPITIEHKKHNSSNDNYFQVYTGSNGNTNVLQVMASVDNMNICTKTRFNIGNSSSSKLEIGLGTGTSNSYGLLKLGNNSLQYVKSDNTTIDLLAGSSSGVQKVTETSPALTTDSSILSVWTINNTIGSADAIVQVYDNTTNSQIANADIVVTASTIQITIQSGTDASAGAFRAVIIG